MFRAGHYGVALALYAPFGGWLLSLGLPTVALAGGAGVLWLTMLPDWDVRVPFLTHRGSTHTLLFCGLLAGGTWGLATATEFGTYSVGPFALRQFAAGVVALAVLAHLAADLLTPMGVALFWPLTDRRFTVSFARADDRLANYSLFALGIFLTVVSAVFGTELFVRAVTATLGPVSALYPA